MNTDNNKDQETVTQPQNLMDGLFSEINRVRELIKEYEDPSLNGAGAFAVIFMKTDIKRAEDAIRESDVIKMLSAYSKLKDNDNENQYQDSSIPKVIQLPCLHCNCDNKGKERLEYPCPYFDICK